MSKRLKELEAKLTLPQQKAAFLLVENDLRDGGDRKTQEQIAEEVGVTYKTLSRIVAMTFCEPRS